MSDCQQYTNIIAEICLRTSWEGKAKIPENNLPYHDFNKVSWAHDSENLSVNIKLIADVSPPPIRKTIFTTGAPWTLYESDDCYIVRWGLQDELTQWEWSVVTSLDFQTVQIYYNSDHYNETPGKISPLALVHYPVDQFLLMNFLADVESTIIHSAGGKIQGKGIIFPGVSGAGKSTLSRLLRTKEGNDLFSDDRMIIRHKGDNWKGYGTPWCGDALIVKNEKTQLDAMLFITQADKVDIVPVTPAWALERLLQVCSIPWYDKKRTQRSLDMCERLIAEVPMYECQFTNTPEAAQQISEMIADL